jgi:L-iditol 2-dehydrogenase
MTGDPLMKAVRLHGPGDLRLHTESVPAISPGEARLRVTAVGVCGSDLLWWDSAGIGDAQLYKPLILGHEFAGVVESGSLAGKRVAVEPAIPCEVCEFCREGNPNLCESIRFAGHGIEDGALRERMVWPESCLHVLPDSISDVEGALLEPLGVALHAVDLAHLRPGMTAGVFGCGPIGLLLLQVAAASGAASLFATEKLPHRMDAAHRLGSMVFPADGEEARAVLEATRGRGVDVAFEAAGDNAAVQAAIEAVKPGGRVILVGIPHTDQTSFTASTARRKGLSLLLCRRMKYTYPRAIRLVEKGLVNLSSLATHLYPLEDTPAAFEAAQNRDGLKVVVRIGESE